MKELPFYKAPIENHALSGLVTLTCCVSAHIIPQLPIKYCKNIKSYSIEVKDSSIKDLFKDFLNETKGFKYQTILKVLLSKCKEHTEREFAPVYFNSTTKTVIGSKDSLDKSFQEIFTGIDNWISEGSGWVKYSITVFPLQPIIGEGAH